MDFVQEVEYYCKQENTSGALLVNGNWGSGKTYFFENVLPQLPWFYSNTSIISISLFGITSREILDKKLKEKYILKNISIPEVSQGKKGILLNTKYALTKFLTETDIKLTEKDVSLKSLFGAAQVFAGAWDNLVQIPPRDKLGKVILIFDDLERCPMNMEELLGAINAYVEGSEIKTILIANEDYIKEKETTNQIYTIMKEKLVCRTIRYSPDFIDVVKKVIEDYKTIDHNYISFLKTQEVYLIQFLQNHKNIRVLKSTIQDFERFYRVINSENIPSEYYTQILEKFCFIMSKHVESVSNSKSNDAMSLWIEQGIWNAEIFRKELQLYKSNTPGRIILRENNILNINDEIWENGILELTNSIYQNHFDLSDYSKFFQILLEASKYNIPVIPLNISMLVSAIQIRIDDISSGKATDLFKYHYELSPEDRENLYSTYPGIDLAVTLLEKSSNDINLLNKRTVLIQALNNNNSKIVNEDLQKYLGGINIDFANAIYTYWSNLKSSRYDFIKDFMISFLPIDNFTNTYAETIKGIEHLISLLSSSSDSDGPISKAQNKEFEKRLLEKRNSLEEKFIVNPKEQAND